MTDLEFRRILLFFPRADPQVSSPSVPACFSLERGQQISSKSKTGTGGWMNGWKDGVVFRGCLRTTERERRDTHQDDDRRQQLQKENYFQPPRRRKRRRCLSTFLPSNPAFRCSKCCAILCRRRRVSLSLSLSLSLFPSLSLLASLLPCFLASFSGGGGLSLSLCKSLFLYVCL